MVRIGAIVLKVSDVRRAATFWSERWLPASREPGLPCAERGRRARLHLDETDRTHLDLWAADEHEQLAEVERLLALGASRVEWNYPEVPISWSWPTQTATCSA